MADPKLRMLFVCVENSNRSQMAEAFARALGGGRVLACSAGSRPSGQVNPRAAQFMDERGLSLASHRSKGLDDLPAEPWDYIVTMGCGEACPSLPARHRLDWALTDPKHLPDDGFREVRDHIAALITEVLVAEGVEPEPLP